MMDISSDPRESDRFLPEDASEDPGGGDTEDNTTHTAEVHPSEDCPEVYSDVRHFEDCPEGFSDVHPSENCLEGFSEDSTEGEQDKIKDLLSDTLHDVNDSDTCGGDLLYSAEPSENTPLNHEHRKQINSINKGCEGSELSWPRPSKISKKLSMRRALMHKDLMKKSSEAEPDVRLPLSLNIMKKTTNGEVNKSDVTSKTDVIKPDVIQPKTGKKLPAPTQDGNNNKEMDKKAKPNPYTTSNWLSKLTFWWLNSYITQGYRKSLTQDDIYDVVPSHGVKKLTDKLEEQREKKSVKSLSRSLLSFFLARLLATGLLAALAEAIKICQPWIVGRLVLYFKKDTSVSQQEAIILAVVLAVSGFVFSLPNSFYFYLSKCMAMQARAMCSCLIFKKSLQVGNSALSFISAGMVFNLMSTDVEKFNNGIPFLHYLWIAPVELAVVMALLYRTVGLAFLPGLAYVIIMIPLQLGLGKIQGNLRFEVAKCTDKRVSIIQEILQGIRVIKMYCWQKPFSKLVSDRRKDEVKGIIKAMLIKGQIESICIVSPKLVTMAILVMYYMTGNAINPDTVVKVIGWTELLKLGALLYLAQAAQYTTEMYSSLIRIEEYLEAEVIEDDKKTDFTDNSPSPPMTPESGIVIKLDHLTTTWKNKIIQDMEKTNPPEVPAETEFSFSLKDIDMEVKKGQLVAVVGPIGSGKTSLLLSILNELSVSEGHMEVHGSVAYVPQEAWLQSTSIRDNVLFGKPYNEARYRVTLQAAALDSDIKLMAKNDQTKVGERGFALSGGQKARVNLARAVYRSCDIYLLDDPLSAVDNKVAKHIFDECICGALKHKTRILVTHQVQFLKNPMVSKIFVMKEGRIVKHGPYHQISLDCNVEDLVKGNEHRSRSLRSQSSIRSYSTSSRYPAYSFSDSVSGTPMTTPTSETRFPFEKPETNSSDSIISNSTESQVQFGRSSSAQSKRKRFARGRDRPTHSSLSRLDSDGTNRSKRFHRRPTIYTRQVSAISNYTGESTAISVDEVFEDTGAFTRQMSSRSNQSSRRSRKSQRRRDVQSALFGVLTMIPQHSVTEEPEVPLDTKSSIKRFQRQNSTFTRFVAYTPEGDQDIDIYHTMDVEEPSAETWAEGEDAVDFHFTADIGGAVSHSVYTRYLRAGYGLCLGPFILILTMAAQAAFNGADWCYSRWHEVENKREWMYLCVGLTCALLVLSLIRSWLFFQMTSFASRNLHHSMFNNVLGAPMSFFEKNPVGQVLNRFTRDMGFMDDFLPQTLHQSLIFITQAVGVIVLTAVTNYWTIIAVLPMLIAIVLIRYFALKALRDLKRIEAANRSPLYSHLSSTLEGIHVLRAFKAEESFIKEFYNFQDQQTSAQFLYLSATRWLALRLDWVVSVYFSGCILAAFFIPESLIDGSLVGLSLSYISSLLGQFQYIVRQTADVETFMTSVERILQYTILPQEVEAKVYDPPSDDWPSEGQIDFKNVSLTYGRNKVLDHVNFTIESKEKVGIIGRSGAGKTSLITCLFRLAPPEGTIQIDRKNILVMGLNDVRSRISIIPQDPILFSGTVRFNLDPLEKLKDKDIWDVLKEVQLESAFTGKDRHGLDTELQEAGGNWSQGERQLLCLARAVLTHNRLMVIDEATANVDKQTDETIQKTLRDSYKDWTVLTIAHRLMTVIDCDKILVMEKGKVAEYDSPYKLLKNQDGVFYQMALQDGDFNTLRNMAEKAYRQRHPEAEGETSEEIDPSASKANLSTVSEGSEENTELVENTPF